MACWWTPCPTGIRQRSRHHRGRRSSVRACPPEHDEPRSHAVMVKVDDVDAHHERARQDGAVILSAPTDYPYGERQYSVEDLAGHRWTFTQAIADLAPEEWGGTSTAALTGGGQPHSEPL
ncbi:MAG: VOC family protein [Nocardioides sp.]|nr:VOC family protein [Nocardioides sp.]